MGDPIRIIEDISSSCIQSIILDNDDQILTLSTQDYKILFYNFQDILNESINDNKSNGLISQYITKKTTILTMKYTSNNVLITLGRFDDNDPKIFM
jgi:hypothetical protein